MKRLGTIFKYVRPYPRLLASYTISNVMSALFSVVSLGMLGSFLGLIFKQGEAPVAKGSTSVLYKLNPLNYFDDWVTKIIKETNALHPGINAGEIKVLGIICLIVLASTILKNFFTFLSFYYLNPIRNHIANNMRTRMYQKILSLPIGYFSEQRKGDIMSRLTNDLAEVEGSTMNVLETTLSQPVLVLFFIISLIILSPELTLFLLLFLPIAGFILDRIGRNLKKQSTEVQEKLGAILSNIEETIGGIRVIKAFNAEGKQFEKFDKENKTLFKIKNAANRRRDLASPVSETMGVLAVVCVLWYGGRLVLHGDFLTPKNFLTYIGIITQLIQPLKALSSASYNIKKGAASIDRIEALINEKETISEVENPIQLINFNDKIEFKNVSFGYGETPILKNINLTVAKGKTVALVGSSGAGKSSLADLVPRFHDITNGQLLIDGKDIRQYSLKSLRNLMGIVTQEPILFNDTIKNNITLGAENVTDAAIVDAAKTANAYQFILQKEAGFETNIGDRGSKLSGGEKQRMTIARAVFKNPPILILDEATSSLDTESERLVQDAINHLMQDRTSIVIAHRLSTIKHADEILVMQKGEIVERGTHQQLIDQNGYYKKLVDMQEVK